MTHLERLYLILKEVPDCEPYYGTNAAHAAGSNPKPFIVYQEISRRTPVFADNHALYAVANIQVTLVSNKKDLVLEKALEKTLTTHELTFALTTEFVSPDASVTRVYEVKMEVLNDE